MGSEASGTTTFNLVDDLWIPVVFFDGTARRCSLREIFQRAADIRSIACESPTQTFVVLRLLEAILIRAIGPVAHPGETWSRLWHAAGLPVDLIDAYLARYHDRFDLLHPTQPFMQVAGLRTKTGDTVSLDRLVPDAGGLFSTRAGGGLRRMSYADAALALLHAQAFDVGGIHSAAIGDPRESRGKVYASGGLGTGYAGELGGLYPEGETLRDTLLLNLVLGTSVYTPFEDFEADRPVWERPQLGPGVETRDVSTPHGIAELFTWQSRRIRLVTDAEVVTGAVVCFGDPLPARNLQGIEPMSAWRLSENLTKQLGHEVYTPRRHRAGRALWRGIEALLALGGPERANMVSPNVLRWIATLSDEEFLDERLVVRTTAVGLEYGTQSAVVVNSIHDTLQLRIAVLRAEAHKELYGTVLAAVDLAEQGARAVGALGLDLALAVGADPIDTSPRDHARERAFAELDAPFRRWLRELGPQTDDAAAHLAWVRSARQTLLALGEALVAEAGPAAWAGRWQESGSQKPSALNAPRAHRRFRAALTKALPLPAEHDQEVAV